MHRFFEGTKRPYEMVGPKAVPHGNSWKQPPNFILEQPNCYNERTQSVYPNFHPITSESQDEEKPKSNFVAFRPTSSKPPLA